jgi:2-oxoisovalerate dehydrogenase E1 component
MTFTSPFNPSNPPNDSTDLSDSIVWNAEAILRDYRVGVRSRQFSVLGRGEVFSGKAKFGIFGDGKETAQLAMAYAFRKGDFRSGYYRDQTLMLALELVTVEALFAQLYAHADVAAEPSSAGRQMTGHFASRLLDDDGQFRTQTDRYNTSADLSPTAAQMPRLVGLAYASKLYRKMEQVPERASAFSDNGNEIAFGTIGNASCAEGLFWESVNAVGVLQVPMLLSIWDDGFGISVPNVFQMTKGDISRILEGFQHRPGGRPGLDIHVVAGWQYPELCRTYLKAAQSVRNDHVPGIIHVTEMTQPMGHSTSGNHERYKAPERLEWEKEYDCLAKMREWILAMDLADADELNEIERAERQYVQDARDRAWREFRDPIEAERKHVVSLVQAIETDSSESETVRRLRATLEADYRPLRRDIMVAVSEVLFVCRGQESGPVERLRQWKKSHAEINRRRYGSDLYSESEESALRVKEVPPQVSDQSVVMNGFEVINHCLDEAFARYPELVAIGEDVGLLGGVNQGWAHLQEKYGPDRISDTGIREATIVGQAIGMALRGFRPIAEVQYLDYFLYALQVISDDLATLHWRTRGGQKAPVIIRTRGHRLEGVWHSGSPMSGIINLVRGIYVCVPRDAVQAAGFYNTLFLSDDAGIVVEVLNAYRHKEALPDNIGEFTIPLGVPEILRRGSDVTIVTYGACCPIANEAASILETVGIQVEIVDVRTLLPFDINGVAVESLKKTNRVLFLDEDCPGGATAYMMQEVIERQGGFKFLDSAPRTLTASEHRPAYGSDGDYFSKPNREQVVEMVYAMMRESDPGRFPEYL